MSLSQSLKRLEYSKNSVLFVLQITRDAVFNRKVCGEWLRIYLFPLVFACFREHSTKWPATLRAFLSKRRVSALRRHISLRVSGCLLRCGTMEISRFDVTSSYRKWRYLGNHKRAVKYLSDFFSRCSLLEEYFMDETWGTCIEEDTNRY